MPKARLKTNAGIERPNRYAMLSGLDKQRGEERFKDSRSHAGSVHEPVSEPAAHAHVPLDACCPSRLPLSGLCVDSQAQLQSQSQPQSQSDEVTKKDRDKQAGQGPLLHFFIAGTPTGSLTDRTRIRRLFEPPIDTCRVEEMLAGQDPTIVFVLSEKRGGGGEGKKKVTSRQNTPARVARKPKNAPSNPPNRPNTSRPYSP